VNPRLRLLIVLVLAGTGMLAFFGYVSWQTAAIHAKKERLANLDLVAQEYFQHELLPAQAMHRFLAANNFYTVVDAAGKLVRTDFNVPGHPDAAQHLLARIETEPDHFAGIVYQGHEYLWTSRPLPDGKGTVYFINRSREATVRSYVKAMGPPILAAAFFVVWLIFWGGAYLVRLYGELDSQRDKLEYQALNDALTQLPNRVLFQDRFGQTLEKSQRDGQTFALAVLDLNRFKEINDLLGHEVGDQVLKEISRRLDSVLRKSDTVARMGGDEFAILMPNTNMVHAEMVAERVLGCFRKPVEIGDQRLEVGGSLGLALYPLHGKDATTLTRAADLAMYECKQLKTRFVVYDPRRHDGQNNLVLLRKMVRAIEEERFDIYYQPQICVDNDAVTGVEALLRWRDEDGSFVSPGEFLPLAEQTGHIREITRWVFNCVFRDYAILADRGYPLRIAVNLSLADIMDDGFASFLSQSMARHNADPGKILLEVAESALAANPRKIGERLGRLARDLKVKISIDDFGTGYSSMTNLQEIMFAEVKIDHSFVRSMRRHEPNYQIVKGVIHLAHDLGLCAVAEGVEEADILEELKELRCDTAQGSYFTEPMPREALLDWLDRRNARSDTSPTTRAQA
jgi:diguanylate cyclase (GGDEF)-like protein